MENHKRIIYLIISALILILPIRFTAFAVSDLGGFGGFIIGTILSFLVILMYQMIYNLCVMMMNEDDVAGLMFQRISPFLGLLSPFFFKKSYYMGLGNFYLFKSGKRIYVFQQKYFSMKCLIKTTYNGDIDSLRTSIKRKLEEIFESELKVSQDLEKYKMWSGSIDKASQRDMDLEKLT